MVNSTQNTNSSGAADFDRINASFADAYYREIVNWVGPRYLATRGTPVPNPEAPSVDNNLYGVALSGGGMRSAIYGLGVLQSLARGEMLRDADYVSTVSGGGYLGSSLSALWSPSEDPPPLSSPLGVQPDNYPYQFPGPAGAESTGSVIHGLETPALRHVRENAKMLAHSPGLFDLETWTGLARYTVKTALLWALVPTALVTLIFLATMYIPEARWDRFSPFEDRLGREAIPWWILLTPVWLLAAFFPISILPRQDRIRQRWLIWRTVNWIRRVNLLLMWSAAGALLMVVGVWAFHEALIQDSGWQDKGLERALAAFGVVGGLLAMISSRIVAVGRGRLLKIASFALTISGYVLIALALVTWYHVLWTTIYPSSENLEIAAGTGWDKWQLFWYLLIGSTVPVALSVTRIGPWFLNWSSLSNLYMRRIRRTWIIGSARDEGDHPADGWSSVAMRDGLRVSDLDGSRKNSPYQLITTALNMPGSTRPELLDRKADGFVISKHTVGSAVTGWRDTAESPLRKMTLAQATAISGAAVSPNMGRNTMPALSPILTLFNIRLGQWIKNPRQRTPLQSALMAPTRLTYFWKELFGIASANDPWIYLSDGGHFENSGLYELFRRRCRYIVAVDGGGEDPDGDLHFSTLGVALRRARVDMGVEVDIDLSRLERIQDSRDGVDYVQSQVAVGTIRYPAGRSHGTGIGDDPNTGIIVYVKSGLVRGQLTPDIMEYVRGVNPKFPHDSTSDQQFDQPQFESYRQLGYLAGSEVVRRAGDGDLKKRFQTIKRAV
jgi:hypothetical protein